MAYNNSAIRVPSAHRDHLCEFNNVLKGRCIHPYARYRYCEPAMSLSRGDMWRVEYDIILACPRTMIKKTLKSFSINFSKIFSCHVCDVDYNYRDRLTLLVTPVPDRVSFVRGECKTLEEEREKFKTIPLAEDLVCEDPVSDDESRTIPESRKSRRRGKGKHHSRTSNGGSRPVLMCQSKPELKDSEDHEECASSSVTTEVSVSVIDKIDAVNKDDRELRTSLVPSLPIMVRMTQQHRTYALSRFRDQRIYQLARLYLAYLMKETTEVVFDGKTKTSIEMELKSEGLPVGEELSQMYYEFCIMNGQEERNVRLDLDSYYGYCRTSRLIRLNQARDSVRKYFGLKGGFEGPQTSVGFEATRVKNTFHTRVSLDGKDLVRYN